MLEISGKPSDEGAGEVGVVGIVDRAPITFQLGTQPGGSAAVTADLFGCPPVSTRRHHLSKPGDPGFVFDPQPAAMRQTQRRLCHTSRVRIPRHARSTNSVSTRPFDHPKAPHFSHVGRSPAVAACTRARRPPASTLAPSHPLVQRGTPTRIDSISTTALDSAGVKNRQNRNTLTRVGGPLTPPRSEAPPKWRTLVP